jgi:predicted permease
MALAIGASTAMFTVVNAVMLRPLPFPDEHELVRIRNGQTTATGRLLWNVPGPQVELIRASERVFSGVVALQGQNRLVMHGGAADRVSVVRTDRGWAAALGVDVTAGRGFTQDEYREGEAARVAVLSHRLWRGWFGEAPPHTIPLVIDGAPHAVVGVYPEGFNFPYTGDVWVPARTEAMTSTAVFARMAPGVGVDEARAAMTALAPEVERQMPSGSGRLDIDVMPARESLVEDEDRVALSLFGVTAVFVAIAGANLVTLLLARALGRRRELALRSALGASRWGQCAPLLADAMVLGAGGAVAGLLLAAWLARPLQALVPGNFVEELHVGAAVLDRPVVGFAVAAALVLGALIGLFTVWRVGRVPAVELLRPGGRGATRPGSRLEAALVTLQLALTMAVLTSGAMLVRHLERLERAPLGLDRDRVVTLQVQLPRPEYNEPAARLAFVHSLLERTRSLPGVAGAGITTVNPLAGGVWSTPLVPESSALAPGDPPPLANVRLVTSGLLPAMGVALRHGRDFTSRDAVGSQPVVIISERMAQHLWPDGEAIGQRLRLPDPAAPWMTVVGVAADVDDFGDVELTWYAPYAQFAHLGLAANIHVMARADGDLAGPIRSIGAVVREIEPDAAVHGAAPMRDIHAGLLDRDRTAARVAALFGGVALALAAIGIYGLVSVFVTRRRAEFGIRVALGASRASILRLVFRSVATMLAAGVAAGALGSWFLARALGTIQTGLDTRVSGVMAGVAVVLTAAALLAAYLPVRRVDLTVKTW